MSITDQFWQYAKEAVFSAATAKTDEDRQSLPAHALTWTQTALEEERQCTPSECPQLAWRGSLFVEAE
jgi:hypothetical protein